MTRAQALVPAWQAAPFIQPTLDSLSAQTHPEFEVLVSVDHCQDGTFEICQRHADRDGRFRVLRQPRRLGYAGNCNWLLANARAPYVAFAFHDDLLAPAFFERLAGALDARDDAELAYCDVDLTHVDGAKEQWTYTALEGAASAAERGRRILAAQGPWWTPNRGLFRREPALTIGGIKPHGAGEFSVDWPWIFRLALLGDFVRVPETLCFKFYKPGSLSRSWAFSRAQAFEVDAALMRELWASDLSSEAKLALAVPLANRMLATLPQLRAERGGTG